MRIFFIDERDKDMGRCDRWDQLNGLRGKVVLNHLLFGEQIYGCEKLQIINSDEKIGVVVKGTELFVYKQKMVNFCVNGNTYIVGDDLLTIKIILKKI